MLWQKIKIAFGWIAKQIGEHPYLAILCALALAVVAYFILPIIGISMLSSVIATIACVVVGPILGGLIGRLVNHRPPPVPVTPPVEPPPERKAVSDEKSITLSPATPPQDSAPQTRPISAIFTSTQLSSSLTAVVPAPPRLSSPKRANNSVQISCPTGLLTPAIQQIILEYLNYIIGNAGDDKLQWKNLSSRCRTNLPVPSDADFYSFYRGAVLRSQTAPLFIGYDKEHERYYDRLSVIVLLQYIIKNKEEEANEILAQDAELVFYAEIVMGYATLYEGTAFQLALASHNIEIAMKMAGYFRLAYSQSATPEDSSELHAQAEMKRQYEERYSVEEKKREEERAVKDDEALRAVTLAILESTYVDACSLALQARDAFDHPAALGSWFKEWRNSEFFSVTAAERKKLISDALSVARAAQAINGNEGPEEFEESKEPEDEKRQAQTQATLQLLNKLKDFRSYLNRQAFETRKAGEHFSIRSIRMLIKACELYDRLPVPVDIPKRLFYVQVIGGIQNFLPEDYDPSITGCGVIVPRRQGIFFPFKEKKAERRDEVKQKGYQLGLDLAFSSYDDSYDDNRSFYSLPRTATKLAQKLKELYDKKRILFFKLKSSLGIPSANQNEQKPSLTPMSPMKK